MSALERWLQGGWLRPLDLALAQSLQRLRPETPEPVLLAAALCCRAVALGHSELPLASAPELLAEIAPELAPPPLPELTSWLALLRESPWVASLDDDAHEPADTLGTVLVLQRDALALRRYWDYETRLATALRTRAAATLPEPTDAAAARTHLHALFPALSSGRLDAQALAAALCLRQRLVLLTGGPGTGKTSTVARALTLLAAQWQAPASLRIALAAPTGKAAARLSEALRDNLQALVEAGSVDPATAAALNQPATTVHRLLGWQAGRVNFAHHRDNPLPADVVVIDEASMVDLPLMTKLVEAVPAHAHLLLIGDRDQLASVETGDVLAAMCDAAGDGEQFPAEVAAALGALLGVAVPVRAAPAAPLAACRVQLRRSYRQHAALQLAPLAQAVRDGDGARVLAALAAHEYAGVDWHDAGDHGLNVRASELALPHLRALAAADDPAQALRLARRFRVLTAVRDGPAGSTTLDAHLASALVEPGGRAELAFHGRLLMITRNSYRHGLFNGDIGVCWREPDGSLRVWFETADGNLRTFLPSALPSHESAFALTVHKAQGSEFDDVLLALPEHGARVIARELIYTGLTRARARVIVWATAKVLAEGIARRSQRRSGLAARLE